MTILEKKSNRRKLSILDLVKKGKYEVSYALLLVEDLSDTGKLTETDYEELAEYLENLLNEETEISVPATEDDEVTVTAEIIQVEPEQEETENTNEEE